MTCCWCFDDRNGYLQGICTFCSRDSFCSTLNIISMIFCFVFFCLSCSCAISSTRCQGGSMREADENIKLEKKCILKSTCIWSVRKVCVGFFLLVLCFSWHPASSSHLHTGGTHSAAGWSAWIPCSNRRLQEKNNVFIFIFIFVKYCY